MFNSVSHVKRTKRGIMLKIIKFTQVLYGLYNFECIGKFDFNIGQMSKTNENEFKFLDEQIKVIKLTHENQ